MIIKKGSTGEVVKLLQEKLGVEADGIFGQGTENALMQWQRSNNLIADGVAGSKTLGAMGILTPPQPTSVFDLNKIKGKIPAPVYSELEHYAEKFNLNTNLRLCHFLSQCAHESRDFKLVTENLSYSPDGLKRYFSKYFPGNLNESYAWNSQKIGSRVYANRMGNGDEVSGEGYKYRGRGYIQITGKENYRRFSKFIGEDVVANPELIATKYPLTSAAYFFDSNNIWKLCDMGSTNDIIEKVTRGINGGINGLADRIDKFNKFSPLLLS